MTQRLGDIAGCDALLKFSRRFWLSLSFHHFCQNSKLSTVSISRFRAWGLGRMWHETADSIWNCAKKKGKDRQLNQSLWHSRLTYMSMVRIRNARNTVAWFESQLTTESHPHWGPSQAPSTKSWYMSEWTSFTTAHNHSTCSTSQCTAAPKLAL